MDEPASSGGTDGQAAGGSSEPYPVRHKEPRTEEECDDLPGQKRRRESEEVGMDIDTLTKVETLGGVLARMSKCDPQVQQWADRMNGRSPNGGADGQAVGGKVILEDPNTGGADGAAGTGGGTSGEQHRCDGDVLTTKSYRASK